jgi:hypothetical protein
VQLGDLKKAIENTPFCTFTCLSLVDSTASGVAETAESDARVIAYDAGLSPEARKLQESMDCCLPDFNVPWCLAAVEVERKAQASSLRCIFGNPFRPVSLAPGLLQWEGATIVKIAQAITEERTFERLPILADALEDAGCSDAAILDHLRGPGPHVRGCWVVDLLLGKN